MCAAQFERASEELELDGQSRVHMQSEAPAGNITVTLAFDYPLSSGLSGFYRAEYLDMHQRPRVVAATQFESMSARKAFPCLDEPALKVLRLQNLYIEHIIWAGHGGTLNSVHQY